MALFDLYVTAVDESIVATLRVLRRYFRTVRVGPFEFDLRGQFEKSHAETFKKIERAQNHLADAVAALDRLREDFAAEKARLERVVAETNAKRTEHKKALAELDTTRDLLQKDKELLQRSIGIDHLRRGRVSGFVSGVLASLLAALLWAVVPRVWPYVQAWMGGSRR